MLKLKIMIFATTLSGSWNIGEHMDGALLEHPEAGKKPAAVALGGTKGQKARAARVADHVWTVEERVSPIPMQEATKRGTYKKKISD